MVTDIIGRNIMTTAKSKELQRIENWLKAVNIDSSKSQDLIKETQNINLF